MHPLDAAATGAAHPVPLLIGTNDREGTLFARTGRQPAAHHAGAARPPVRHAPTRPRGTASSRPTRATRAGARSADVAGRPRVLVAEHAGRRGARRHAPTFVYRYDLAPRLARLAGLGATHAAELVPVFG